MIMVHWDDDSELVIYRPLAVIRTLVKRIEQVAPPTAFADVRDATRPFKKRNIFGDNRLSVHLNLVEPLNNLFSVAKYYKSILGDSTCKNFFYKR